MKLWYLKRIYDLPENDDPWFGLYDFMNGVVVRARSESSARQIAAQVSVENEEDDTSLHNPNPWLDNKYTTCEEVSAEGEPSVIIRDCENG